MASRIQRKIRRTERIEGWKERRATRSKYATKKFEKEQGRLPRHEAESEARRKT